VQSGQRRGRWTGVPLESRLALRRDNLITAGVQLLGGHGYTKEHPVERWYRDLRAIGVAEGVVVI